MMNEAGAFAFDRSIGLDVRSWFPLGARPGSAGRGGGGGARPGASGGGAARLRPERGGAGAAARKSISPARALEGCGEWGERPIGGARAAAPADGADSTRADAPAVDGAPASNPADGAADAGGAGGTRDARASAVAADGDQTTAPDAGASAAPPPTDDQAGSAPASPPDGAPATARLPKGFMEASSPSAGLTIGLPSGWGDLASYPETDLIPLAEDLGIDDTALLRTRIGSFEVFKTAAPSSGVPFAPRVYIDMESHPGAPTSPPASFYDGLSGQRVTIDHNELVGTVNGQGTIGYFSDAPLGGADHGALLHLPNSEGEFVNVVLFTSSEGEALELAHLIAFSAH